MRSLDERASRNLAAIRLLRDLEASGRPATADEKETLARYSGWGAMPRVFDRWPGEWREVAEELRSLVSEDEWTALEASTPNAHYTSLPVIAAMWEGAQRLGLDGDARVLEPALGVGHFFGLQPADIAGERTGIELEGVSARIARALYPDSAIHVGPFQSYTRMGSYDLVITNVPFGRYGVVDPSYRRGSLITRAIHDYFLGRAAEEVRPGGIVAVITSRYTMDKANNTVRRWLDERADLLAAFRLPSSAFEQSAGTSVVTDVLFLQRRFPGGGRRGEDWIHVGEWEREPVNRYFLDHPHHVLGHLSLGRGLYSDREVVVEGTLDAARLNAMVAQLPEAVVPDRDGSAPTIAVPDLQAATDAKEGAYLLRDGRLHVVAEGVVQPAPLTGARAERVRSMVEVRDAAVALVRKQLEPCQDHELHPLRQRLNLLYDSHGRRWGPLTARANASLVRDDPDAGLLLSLEENYDAERNAATKAAIFSRRTTEPYRPPERVETAAEALSVTLGETGRLDWPRMVALTGRDAPALVEELGDLVFEDPALGRWVTREEYLSGDVRFKLEQARSAAAGNAALARNVRALEAVQPRDLTPAEIKVALGAPWIPAEDVQAFARHLLAGGTVRVEHSPAIASWVVQGDAQATVSVENRRTWGTPRAPALGLLEDALNQRTPTVTDMDSVTQRAVVNLEETIAARERQAQIREEFDRWVWSDAERAQRLAETYNRRFNAIRACRYDGSHLRLPGMARGALRTGDLAAHQKDAVWRQLQQHAVLLALPVGAGKTFAMIAGAHEARRLSLVRKPMVVVPTALVEQWAAEWYRLYPDAKILVGSAEHLAAGRRQQFLARAATSAYDAIIVAHSSFAKLPLRAETETALLRREMRRLEDAIYEARENDDGPRGRRSVVKELEAAKRRLETRIDNLARRDARDDGLRFEELGIDGLYVDEAHYYKNLLLVTRMTRVAGLPSSESARAWDMYAKTRHVMGEGGRVVFATATPVTNTLAEIFNMQRYLQEDALERLDIGHFDAWAATFARTVTAVELAPDGTGYRSATRFAAFQNVPELAALFSEVSELRSEKELQLQRPVLRGGKPEVVVVPGAPELQEFIRDLGDRADKIRSRTVDPREDNMLKVSGDGRRAALDLREVGLETTEPQKVHHVAERVHAIWQDTAELRAAQVVFCDLSTPKRGWSFYDALRDDLAARGVPADEIAFIHEADDEAAKLRLFEALNDGRVRIVLGSTDKLGVGSNFQKRLIAAHHADAPWRPADVEQRNGRILRPGNTHPEVRVHYYVTEGSFDAYMWQTLERKQRFIDQLMRGEVTERSIEDVGGNEALTAAEAKALATGNPEIVEVVRLDVEIRRLATLQRHHRDQQQSARWEVQSAERTLAETRARLGRVREDLRDASAVWAAAGERSPGLTVGTRHFGGDGYRARVASALSLTLERVRRDDARGVTVGTYLSFDLVGSARHRLVEEGMVLVAELHVRGRETYEATWEMERPESGVASVEAVVHPRRLEQRAAQIEAEAERIAHRIDALRVETARPFEHDATLRDLRERHGRIVARLRAREETVVPEEPAQQPGLNPPVDLEHDIDPGRSAPEPA